MVRPEVDFLLKTASLATHILEVIGQRSQSSEGENTTLQYLLNPTGFREFKKRRKQRHWAFPVSRSYFSEIWEFYDDERFLRKYRMSRITFNYICDQLAPVIRKEDTQLRPCIPVNKRVAVALHLLKSNCDTGTVADLYGIGESTAKKLLHEFCDAVEKVLKPKHLKFPTGQEFLEIIHGFENTWGFPGCIGALDGSHIPIVRPDVCGSDFFNYKKYYSIVLLGLVDFKYRFTYANVGHAGKNCDSTIFSRSSLHKKLNDNQIGIAGQDFHIISDAAFPLQNWLMKPYIENENTANYQLNFNYRLSRARMVVENGFGRLKGRWRILLKRIDHEVQINVTITCPA